MRVLSLLLLLTAFSLSAGAAPPAPERPGPGLHITVPLTGDADRPAWQPAPARAMDADHVLRNLSEGWLGITILAVGGGVLIYEEIEGR